MSYADKITVWKIVAFPWKLIKDYKWANGIIKLRESFEENDLFVAVLGSTFPDIFHLIYSHVLITVKNLTIGMGFFFMNIWDRSKCSWNQNFPICLTSINAWYSAKVFLYLEWPAHMIFWNFARTVSFRLPFWPLFTITHIAYYEIEN